MPSFILCFIICECFVVFVAEYLWRSLPDNMRWLSPLVYIMGAIFGVYMISLMPAILEVR